MNYQDLVKWDGLYYEKSADVPFTGKVTGRIQGSFKDGKQHGPWVHYYESGQLWMKGTYKNGKEEGPWVSYKPDGKLGAELDETTSGAWVGYHGNGQLWMKGTYKNGKREGAWIDYYRDGTVNENWTGTYKNGDKISD